MKITSTLKSEPVGERCFNITFENDNLKTNVCIWNPLNLYGNEYSDSMEMTDPKKEWKNMYDAIVNNEEYRLDLNQNKTSLMIESFDGKVLFSSIPDNSNHNMIDIYLSLNDHKDELLKVIGSLIDVLDFLRVIIV